MSACPLLVSGCSSSSDSGLGPGATDDGGSGGEDPGDDGGGEDPGDDDPGDPGGGDPGDPGGEDPDDPTGPCPPWTPSEDRVLHAGAAAVGTTGVTTTGTVTTLFFQGDERVEYEVDVGHPDVAGGLVRVVEGVSGARPLAGGGPLIRTSDGVLHAPDANPATTTLLSVATTEDSLVLEYEDQVEGRSLLRRHTYTIVGKTLRIRVQSLLPDVLSWVRNYAGFATGPAAGLENPTVLEMQGALATPTIAFEKGGEGFFYANLLDPTQSNAADLHLPDPPTLPPGAQSIDFGYDTAGLYARTTSGAQAAALDETLSIVVTRRLADALVLPSQARSPYRTRLASRTVALMSSDETDWAGYASHLQKLSDWGMDDLAVYYFDFWTSSAYEGAQNVGPDWAPAKDEAAFQAMVDTARDAGQLVGVYTLFQAMPPSSPAYEARDVVVDESGNPKTSSFELTTEFPLASDAGLLDDVQREAGRLVGYGATLGFADVTTYALPSKQGSQLDQDASTNLPKTLREAIRARKAWLSELQSTLAGPLLGEGSIAQAEVSTEWVWAGYCDSVQRVINTGSGLKATDVPAGDPRAPTAWPVVPEYELRAAPRHQVHHGNGFYNRFFGPTDGASIVSGGEVVFPLTEEATDRYRVYELTYGHAGFFQSNGIETPQGNYLTAASMLKEYYLTNALQALYASARVVDIEYFDGDYATFEEVYFEADSMDPFLDPRIRLRYDNGLEVFVNHSPAEWVLDFPAPLHGQTQFVLPEDGFLARVEGSSFLAFSGWTPAAPGQRIDYCDAPGRYTFFDGRGAVAGFDGLTTKMPSGQVLMGIRVVNHARGVDLIERSADEVILYPSGLTAPALLGVTVLGPSANLRVGSRAALVAVAQYANGSYRDVSTLVDWTSSDEGVARIDRGGVVHGCEPGTVAVGALDFQGVPVQSANLTVVD